MNQLTYHHYGATVLNAPIAQLRRDMHTILNVPPDLVRTRGHTAAVLEEVIDRVAGTHTLAYRSTVCAPEIAEYVATCTLACGADAPHTTFIEWMREYRPAALTDNDQMRPFVSALIDQDQAIAAQFAAEYGSTEVFYIDYTLGGA
jgi:hypothetical protein